jgi:soluble cytochrome b562
MSSSNEPPSGPTQPPVIEPEAAPLKQGKNFLKPVSEALARLPRHQAQGLFWLAVLATSTLTGAIAFQWLTGLPSTPNCRKLFQATLSDSGQLYCADQAARKGDEASLSSALKLASSINQNDPLFEQSRQLADHWSKSILVLARRKVEAGNLKKGIELAQQVPTTSPVHAEAQAMIKDWQGNWKQGEAIFQKAKKAIQDQDWGQATEQVRNLVQIGSDYWQKRADTIVAEIAIEQQAFLKISEAQILVDSGSTENIAKAIQSVSKIDPQRLARKRVGEKIDEWSQKLIDVAKSAQANGNYEEAMKAAQKVPPNAKGAKDAAAYLQIGRAATLENKDSLWSSIQAYAYSTQIDSTTPAYEASREQRQKWEGQVQNWGQLEIARWFADIDQISGYRTAIDQAKMVAPNQPRRVEAQTLIASWTKQIDTFSDHQFLARAKQMAVENTVASLQMAIAEAGKALSGGLQNTAQALVAEWSNAVERVEDKPILDQARTLAQKGDLTGAIQIAEKIDSSRALYREARDDIYTWTGRIQAVEDRPILNEAEALANEGRLSEAIARASDIGSNRTMYGEAQSRIGDWAAQRRQIEDANRPQPAAQDAAPSPESSDTSADQAAPPPETPESGTVDNSAPPPADAGSQDSAPPPEPAPAPESGDQGGSNPNF